jgi:hypothetical protein
LAWQAAGGGGGITDPTTTNGDFIERLSGSLARVGSTGTGTVVLNTSPGLSGNPTAPTQSAKDSSTRIATDAYVDRAVSAGIVSTHDIVGANAGNTHTYTTPNDGQSKVYRIEASVNITTNSGLAATLTCTVSFTDETGAAQTKTLYNQGSTTASFSALGYSTIPPFIMNAAPNTNITILFAYNSNPILYNTFTTITKIR